MRKPGKLRVKKVWAQLTNPTKSLIKLDVDVDVGHVHHVGHHVHLHIIQHLHLNVGHLVYLHVSHHVQLHVGHHVSYHVGQHPL